MQLKQMNGESVQLFVPDAAKSQVTASMTGTITLKKGTGASVNIVNWCAMRVTPVAVSSYYFNTDATKVVTLPAGIPTDIWVIDPGITQVVLVLGATTASIQGM